MKTTMLTLALLLTSSGTLPAQQPPKCRPRVLTFPVDISLLEKTQDGKFTFIYPLCPDPIADAKALALAEAERKAKAAADAHEQAVGDQAVKAAKDPKTARMVLSANLCLTLFAKAATLAELQKDRKYSAIGGAVDLSYRSELQDTLQEEDENIGEARALLRSHKVTPLPCSGRATAILARCLPVDPNDQESEEGDDCRAFHHEVARATLQILASE